MRTRLSDVQVFEVYTANDDYYDSTLDAEPSPNRKKSGCRHVKVDGGNGEGCLALLGFHKLSEARAYGCGARDAKGADSVGFVTKYIADDLSVCLVEYFKGDPEFHRFDYRNTIGVGEASL